MFAVFFIHERGAGAICHARLVRTFPRPIPFSLSPSHLLGKVAETNRLLNVQGSIAGRCFDSRWRPIAIVVDGSRHGVGAPPEGQQGANVCVGGAEGGHTLILAHRPLLI